MSAVGGSIESVTINGRTYPVAADAEAQVKLGGFENEVQSNGNGSARTIKTRVPWSITGLNIEVDHTRGDAEEIQAVANLTTDVSVSVTFADGTIYSGTGTVTDESTFSSQSATRSVSLSGPGVLTKQ